MATETPPAAQVVYTTNFLTSPQFIGAVVTLILLGARQLGLDLADNAQTQDMLSVAIGWGLGAVVKWFFPHADGRLGLTAPAAWSVPAPQNVPMGTASIVTVPAAGDDAQVATVTPVDLGTQVVTVKQAMSETRLDRAEPMAVIVTPPSMPREPEWVARGWPSPAGPG